MDADQVQQAANEVVQREEDVLKTARASSQVTAPIESFSDVKPELLKFLYENPNPMVAHALQFVEQKTGVKRENIFYGIVAVLAIYMVLGSAAELLCNLIGFGYPAYASVKAVRTETKDDDTQWLTYWTVFASFSLLDFFSEAVMNVLPLYWLVKVGFLLYLALPQTLGALKMYARFVDPAVTKLDAVLAQYGLSA